MSIKMKIRSGIGQTILIAQNACQTCTTEGFLVDSVYHVMLQVHWYLIVELSRGRTWYVILTRLDRMRWTLTQGQDLGVTSNFGKPYQIFALVYYHFIESHRHMMLHDLLMEWRDMISKESCLSDHGITPDFPIFIWGKYQSLQPRYWLRKYLFRPGLPTSSRRKSYLLK